MKRTILIIANPYDAAVLRRAVLEAGFEVALAIDGDVQEIARSSELVAVLLDHRLTAADSQQVLEVVRREQQRHLPVILIGSPGMGIGSLADAIRFGADHLLLRPIDPTLVTSKLEALLAREDFEVAPTVRLPDSAPTPRPDETPVPAAERSRAEGAAAQPSGGALPPDLPPLPRRRRLETGPTTPAVGSLDELASVVEAPPELPGSGGLGAVDLPALLRLLHLHAFSGRLKLRRDAVDKAIYFDDGYPVFATSSARYDRLGELLAREGRVAEGQLGELGLEQAASGRRLGAILVDRGLVRPDELFPLVRRHVTEIIYSLFSWESGEFVLEPGLEADGEQIQLQLHPNAVILEGVRRKYGLERLMGRLGTMSARVQRREGVELDLEAAGLEPDERVLFDRLAGEQSLATLAEGELDAARCCQLVYGLLIIGVVVVRGGGSTLVGLATEPVLRLLERQLAVDERRILAKHAQVREADYFSLLGLGSDASRREIEQAYRRLLHDFSAEVLASELVEAHAEALDEIRLVLLEAHRVLGDDALREAYRGSLS